MLVLGIIPALGLMFGTWLVVPESPRWLISTSKTKQALEVLKQIRESEIQAINELEEVEKLVEYDRKINEQQMDILTMLLSERLGVTRNKNNFLIRWIYRCLLVGIGIALCNQVTG